MEWEQKEDSSAMWELGQVKPGAWKTSTRARGRLAATANSLISVTESHLDPLWAGVVALALEFCILYHSTSASSTVLAQNRLSGTLC